MISHSTIAFTIISALLILLIGSLIDVNAESTFETEFDYNDIHIYLFIVDDVMDMPCNGVGCAVWGYDGAEEYNLIYLLEDYVNKKDMFGYSNFYHELRHIICHCNWHEGLSWV